MLPELMIDKFDVINMQWVWCRLSTKNIKERQVKLARLSQATDEKQHQNMQLLKVHCSQYMLFG